MNLLDSELEKIIAAGKDELFLPSEVKSEAKSENNEKNENTISSEIIDKNVVSADSGIGGISKADDNTDSAITDSAVTDSDFQDAKALLSFSVHLLRNSINKDIYNSTEVQSSCLS